MTDIHNHCRIFEESYEGLIAHDCSDGDCEVVRIDFSPVDLLLRVSREDIASAKKRMADLPIFRDTMPADSGTLRSSIFPHRRYIS